MEVAPKARSLPLAVFVLGLAVFCIGTTEVMVSGLLPMLSRDLTVSIPTAGLLISGYAAGVVVGGPILTLAFLKTPRKKAVLILVAVFVIGQAFGARAPHYTVLMASRVLAALAQGALFGIGSLLAVDLAGQTAKGRALAVMFGGLTIANVFGAPLGTLIGDAWGWRASFWAVAGVAALSLVAIARVVPAQSSEPYAGMKREFESLSNPRLWWALSVTALSQGGLFAAYSYFSPIFTEDGGFAAGAVPFLQALFGFGCFIGTMVGGRFTDRYLHQTLYLGLGALVLTMAAFALLIGSKVAAIIALSAFGVAAFSINPPLQAQVINETESAPTLATTMNTSAFNIGNTIGPWLGGVAITAGWGFTSAVWSGAALVSLALCIAFVTARRAMSVPAGKTQSFNLHS
jgi:DHA1 family inner membrane transport protein